MGNAKYNAYQRQWRKNNPEKVRAIRQRHKPKEYVTRRKWLKRNPEQQRAYRRRRARRQISELRPRYIKQQMRRCNPPATFEQVRNRILIRRAQRLLKPMLAASMLSARLKSSPRS